MQRQRLTKKYWKKTWFFSMLSYTMLLAVFLYAGTAAALNVDSSKISVVGLSSGGYMASQMHVAFSKTFMGAGVVAGGPYYCAEDDTVDTVLARCMFGAFLPAAPSAILLAAKTSKFANEGKIDHLSWMTSDSVYIWSSYLEDFTVNPFLGDVVHGYYEIMLGPEGRLNIDHYFLPWLANIAHGIPTNSHYFKVNPLNELEPCAPIFNQGGEFIPLDGDDPWIYDCSVDGIWDMDLSYKMIDYIYGGSLVKPDQNATLKGTLLQFNQLHYVDDPDVHDNSDLMARGINEYGHIYVPPNCAGGGNSCKMVVTLHGCGQFFENEYYDWQTGGNTKFADKYYRRIFNQLADANDIIILYPQAYNIGTSNTDVNPHGCWEFWNFYHPENYPWDDSDYAFQSGRQMTMIKNMIDSFSDPESNAINDAEEVYIPHGFLPFVDSEGNLSALHVGDYPGNWDYDDEYGNPHDKWNWTLTSNQTWDKPLGVGDINNDGRDDVIVVNGGGSIWAVLTPEPGGEISRQYIGNPHDKWGWALTSNQTWDKPLGVGDINNDGRDDIIVVNGGGSIWAVLTPEPGGEISRQYIGNPHDEWGWALTSNQTTDKPLGVGDINGDGRDDIILVNHGGDINAVLIPPPGGSISSRHLGNPHLSWGWALSSVQTWDKPIGVGDVNGDELADIIVVNGNGAVHAVLTPVSGEYGSKANYTIKYGDASQWDIGSGQTEKETMMAFGWWGWQ